ncbi:uncharacterized protein LOC113380276 [Ctenocephalides felis]|uniref:uncharacterized protein LOC113380276 n=1 Tax=Ctenocephalides felis TaxID=7515 RepID=UPI000E6E5B13|nr:uncharacterized protein LOC113380276 [Ctenocephalides felis]
MRLKTEDEILQELSLLDNTTVQDRDFDDFFEHLEIDMSDLVTCPCCLKNAIGNDSEGLIICKCGLRLRKGNIKDLESEIWMNVNMHSANCSRTPQFISMPNDVADVLIIGCPDCKFSKVVY